MSLMTEFLKYSPIEWEVADYRNERFFLIDVPLESEEFNEIKEFVKLSHPRCTIEKIQRIQNPYNYGRFMLRKMMSNGTEKKEIVYVEEENLKELVECNGDKRKLRSSFYLSKNTMLIKKKLDGCVQEHDANCYAAYFVKIKNEISQDVDGLIRNTSLLNI